MVSGSAGSQRIIWAPDRRNGIYPDADDRVVLFTAEAQPHGARWGKMSDWLEFHIFTGLVGPFQVLLYSSWKFQGLAGAVMLMTVVIVVSGYIGRYIYTAVPRTVDGAEIQESFCVTCHTNTNWFASYSGPHPSFNDHGGINHECASCRDCQTVNLISATSTKCHDSNNPND